MDAPVKQITVVSSSAAETKHLGEKLGALLQPPLVLALHGDLGAGKTTLTQGIATGLGIAQRVTSPTFTLVNEYPLHHSWRLIHIDSYRLNAGEAETIGLDEILDDELAIVIIEWAERVAELLPQERFDIQLLADKEAQTRKIIFSAVGESVKLLQALQEQVTIGQDNKMTR
ncbi:MAG: tRNA (adenosine(37)-N6)-threonylcarbamoyltransferase complex ATPase subunit type 1 TsaE [Caldilineaceae bacterium]